MKIDDTKISTLLIFNGTHFIAKKTYQQTAIAV
jgi:hypothetical protein